MNKLVHLRTANINGITFIPEKTSKSLGICSKANSKLELLMGNGENLEMTFEDEAACLQAFDTLKNNINKEWITIEIWV